jgi:hypothetical protein
MRSSTVAFRGIPQVIEAYRANDMAPWAIVSSKTVMFAFETDDIEQGCAMLKETLRRLYDGGSQAQFELRTYELGRDERIKSSTPHLRGFPFVLYDDENESPYHKGRQSYQREADEKIGKLEKELEELKLLVAGQDEEEEKPEGINGFLSGIFTDPMMKQTLQQALIGFVQKIVPMNTAARPAAVAGIENGEQQVQSVLQPGQPEKVQQALNILCANDPLLGDHLLKLANVALNNRQSFDWMLGMLQKM